MKEEGEVYVDKFGMTRCRHVNRLSTEQQLRIQNEMPKPKLDLDGNYFESSWFEYEVSCKQCGKVFVDWDEHFSDWDGMDYCKSCIEPFQDAYYAEAVAFAEKHVKVIRDFPIYDPNTPQSDPARRYIARCRHDCTNYDDLLLLLHGLNSGRDILYFAIKELANELAIKAMRADLNARESFD